MEVAVAIRSDLSLSDAAMLSAVVASGLLSGEVTAADTVCGSSTLRAFAVVSSAAGVVAPASTVAADSVSPVVALVVVEANVAAVALVAESARGASALSLLLLADSV